MISIRLNDEVMDVEKNKSLMDLLTEKGMGNISYAVAINRQFVPCQQHATRLLVENDVIEIIVPMQGG